MSKKNMLKNSYLDKIDSYIMNIHKTLHDVDYKKKQFREIIYISIYNIQVFFRFSNIIVLTVNGFVVHDI